jgi:hypothetical protein
VRRVACSHGRKTPGDTTSMICKKGRRGEYQASAGHLGVFRMRIWSLRANLRPLAYPASDQRSHGTPPFSQMSRPDAAVAPVALKAQHRRGQCAGSWSGPAWKARARSRSFHLSRRGFHKLRNSLRLRKLCQEPRRIIGTSSQSKSPSRSGPSCSTALSAVVASITSLSTSTP